MYEILLEVLPNQEINVMLDNVEYILTIQTIKDMTIISITRDNEIILTSQKCVPFILLINYKYLTKGGNFIFDCQDSEYPFWTKFGEKHRLYYLSDEELQELQENVN
ncbi:MAG: hypothetical protein LBF97_01195 [Elusimicrobiota bacterium]|jgi:hypothetical protein|nr:hypothetical protein [Elusimicrobiota bacterium]